MSGLPSDALRIEMVLPNLARAGMEMMTRDLAIGLTARGHQVGVTCIEEEGALAAGLRAQGVPVRVVESPGVKANLRPDKGLANHFSSLCCDVVHAHNGVWAKAALAARAARVPSVVCTMHGVAHSESWVHDSMRWWGALHADAVVAVSASLRDLLATRTRITKRRITVLRNGIDTDRFAPGPRTADLRQRYEIADGDPVIGCVARLDPVKNHPLLLAAFVELLPKLPRLRLVFIGDGLMREQLERQAQELGISSSVIFAGASANTAPLYHELDAFVLGSHSEGTSISILEALASGTPVVATAVGGTPDLLANGCGLLVPADDPGAMAAAILSVLTDRDLRADLSRKGRAKAVSAFSLAAMVDGYLSIYRRTLETSGPRLQLREAG